MGKLILLRHGQSEWNRLGQFTGWVDIPLSEKGVEEAFQAGEAIAHLPIDIIYTSTLMRAQMTYALAMLKHSDKKVPRVLHASGKQADWAKIYDPKSEKQTVPVICAWQLNERYYGELQGKNKDEMRKEYGEEQVHIWRRSFDVPPPNGESLKMTAERTIPYFEEEIVPRLKRGENVLVSAHGNSLRSIVMDLEKLTEKEVLSLELPTGEPRIYQYNQGKWTRA